MAAEHTVPGGHGVAHAPQLSLSDCVSTHVPEQSTEVSPVHVAPHTPLEQ